MIHKSIESNHRYINFQLKIYIDLPFILTQKEKLLCTGILELHWETREDRERWSTQKTTEKNKGKKRMLQQRLGKLTSCNDDFAPPV